MLESYERVIFDDNCDFLINRNYSNLKVHSSKVPELNKALKAKLNGKLINSLYIHNFYYDSIDVDINIFKEVLNNCPNLKNLNTSIDFIANRKNDFNENFPKLNLDTLWYSKNVGHFEVFQNCTTKKLKIYFGLEKFMSNTQGIKDFLKNQKELTELELWFCDRALSLFSDTQLHSVDFRLKKFKIVGKGLVFTDLMSFEKFIWNHKDTLEHLEIFACQNIIDSFMVFEKLKTIDLKEVDVSSEPFVYAERVSLLNVSGSYLMKFPNVKELYINRNDLSLIDFRPLTNLKTLELSVMKIECISLPHITNLKLNCVKLFNKLDIPCTVESITLKDCMNIDWLLDYLKMNKKLKNVKIIGSKITEKMAMSIERFSHINDYMLEI
ncbi:hypothetical protein PVAND_013614 [Polypedilum vanderplanki]|uniref:Leucine-rich repeat domain-containing protein n=1 Tax=Polypedilum vanderplanki TaxID=319348 RepID=A0A9J6CS51_POLVA|nr:hypothetical protein PVAND_013614 [Polypedilum vanderplanki]